MSAAAHLTCAGPLILPSNALINLQAGPSFGAAITVSPVAQSFLLQPGLYEMHFDAADAEINLNAADSAAAPTLVLNGAFTSVFWPHSLASALSLISGDRFVLVTQPNTTASISSGTATIFHDGCDLSVVKLQ